MQAHLTIEGEVTIVKLMGYIDFETAAPFRRTCLETLKERKVILDFSTLHFVGSSGISLFLETILEFHMRSPQTLKLCSVGTEFRRILTSGDLARLEIYENPTQALLAFQMAQMGGAQFVQTQATSLIPESKNWDEDGWDDLGESDDII